MSTEIDDIVNNEVMDFNLSFELLKRCSKIINGNGDKKEAQEILIYMIENIDKVNNDTKDMLTDLIEAMGFYPYVEKYKDKIELKDTASKIRKEFFKSQNLTNIYLHEEQKELLDKIKQGKNLIISAPTSFGKSLLIEEVVASKKYNNIVIIQPTLALLDETRKKLNKYKGSYKIIVRTSQTFSEEKGNIFLLTAERVLEYRNLPKIDFLVLDEFYKLSSRRDDERYEVLNNSLYLLLNKHKCKFLLLGPNIEGISEGFTQKYNAEFYKTQYSLVVNEEVDYYSEFKGEFGDRGKRIKYKEEKLFELLYSLKEEQTIIFCSSPDRVRRYANDFVKFLKEKEIETKESIPLIEWIEKNISKDWSIIECLKYRIGIHDGAIPKHITSSVVKYFNQQELNYLFCTTTIIEGVNTSAKNIIYFDETKGLRVKIDYFDYSNIKGRAGRMMVHLIGKIYNFNKPPEQEKIIVDIPFFEQNPISDEILIHLDEDEIVNKQSEQNKHIQSIKKDLKQIFKTNGVSVKGQEKIYNILEKNFNYELINWTGTPKYNQLKFVLEVAWDNLIKEGETVRPMTINQLVKQTFDYGINKNISYLIKSNFDYYKLNHSKLNDKEIWDIAIKDAFKTHRHWLQYKVPKWLNVVNSIQEYVCKEKGVAPGNYTYYAGMMENDFVQENLSILSEYNIPSSAINKITDKVPSGVSEDILVDYIVNNDLINKCDLIEYERDIIKENLIS